MRKPKTLNVHRLSRINTCVKYVKGSNPKTLTNHREGPDLKHVSWTPTWELWEPEDTVMTTTNGEEAITTFKAAQTTQCTERQNPSPPSQRKGYILKNLKKQVRPTLKVLLHLLKIQTMPWKPNTGIDPQPSQPNTLL